SLSLSQLTSSILPYTTFFRSERLAEQFVYFNDDMFLTKPVKKEDFFKDGLPRDVAVPNPTPSRSRLGIGCAISNNMEIINTTFNKRKSIRRNFLKWFNLFYGIQVIDSICMIPCKHFASFSTRHIPHPYLKSTFKEGWENEEEILNKTSKSKFRSNDNVNQWLMRYWQLASGNFQPGKVKDGKNFMLTNHNEEALRSIKNQKYKMICLNDTVKITEFEKVKNEIINSFEGILDEKSDFEI